MFNRQPLRPESCEPLAPRATREDVVEFYGSSGHGWWVMQWWVVRSMIMEIAEEGAGEGEFVAERR